MSNLSPIFVDIEKKVSEQRKRISTLLSPEQSQTREEKLSHLQRWIIPPQQPVVYGENNSTETMKQPSKQHQEIPTRRVSRMKHGNYLETSLQSEMKAGRLAWLKETKSVEVRMGKIVGNAKETMEQIRDLRMMFRTAMDVAKGEMKSEEKSRMLQQKMEEMEFKTRQLEEELRHNREKLKLWSVHLRDKDSTIVKSLKREETAVRKLRRRIKEMQLIQDHRERTFQFLFDLALAQNMPLVQLRDLCDGANQSYERYTRDQLINPKELAARFEDLRRIHEEALRSSIDFLEKESEFTRERLKIKFIYEQQLENPFQNIQEPVESEKSMIDDFLSLDQVDKYYRNVGLQTTLDQYKGMKHRTLLVDRMVQTDDTQKERLNDPWEDPSNKSMDGFEMQKFQLRNLTNVMIDSIRIADNSKLFHQTVSFLRTIQQKIAATLNEVAPSAKVQTCRRFTKHIHDDFRALFLSFTNLSQDVKIMESENVRWIQSQARIWKDLFANYLNKKKNDDLSTRKMLESRENLLVDKELELSRLRTNLEFKNQRINEKLEKLNALRQDYSQHTSSDKESEMSERAEDEVAELLKDLQSKENVIVNSKSIQTDDKPQWKESPSTKSIRKFISKRTTSTPQFSFEDLLSTHCNFVDKSTNTEISFEKIYKSDNLPLEGSIRSEPRRKDNMENIRQLLTRSYSLGDHVNLQSKHSINHKVHSNLYKHNGNHNLSKHNGNHNLSKHNLHSNHHSTDSNQSHEQVNKSTIPFNDKQSTTIISMEDSDTMNNSNRRISLAQNYFTELSHDSKAIQCCMSLNSKQTQTKSTPSTKNEVKVNESKKRTMKRKKKPKYLNIKPRVFETKESHSLRLKEKEERKKAIQERYQSMYKSISSTDLEKSPETLPLRKNIKKEPEMSIHSTKILGKTDYQRVASMSSFPKITGTSKYAHVLAERPAIVKFLFNMIKVKTRFSSVSDPRESLLHAFRAFDLDGGGTVNSKEFHKGLRMLGHVVSYGKVKKMMREIDVDGNMVIEYEEFVDALLPR